MKTTACAILRGLGFPHRVGRDGLDQRRVLVRLLGAMFRPGYADLVIFLAFGSFRRLLFSLVAG